MKMWRKFAIVISCLCIGPQSHAGYTIYFVGADDLHLMVSHTPRFDETHYYETLTAPGGTETTLINGVGPVGGTEKQAMASGGVQGEWKHHTDLTYTNSSGTVLHDINNDTFNQTNIITGTMLFDETIGAGSSDSFALGSINVYSGIKLTLNNSIFGGGGIGVDAGTVNINGASLGYSFHLGLDNGATVEIDGSTHLNRSSIWLSDGTLTIAGNAYANSVDFTFAGGSFNLGNLANFSGCKFHYQTNPGNSYVDLHPDVGEIRLEAGSEGAQIAGTNYDIIMLQNDVSFDSAEKINLTIGCPATISSGLFDSRIQIGVTDTSPQPTFPYAVTLSGLNIEHLAIGGATDCEVMNCEIGTAYISGGSPKIHGNAFAGDVTVIYGGKDIQLTGNTFHGTLVLHEPFYPRIPGSLPTISGNDFMGPSAIVYSYGISTNPLPTEGSIKIDKNYYGSPKGPSTDHSNYRTVLYGIFGDNGAQFGTDGIPDYKQHYEYFDIQGFSTAPMVGGGEVLYDRQPHFWLAGWGRGQGVLNWYPRSNDAPLYKGVPAIVAFDIRCSKDGTPADCYLENITAGTTIQPKYQPRTFSRLLENPMRAMQGINTVVFEVPPPVSHDTVHYELHLCDKAGNDKMLMSNYLYFTNHPWARPLKIAIVPVKVEYWLSSKPAPPAGPMQSAVKQNLPAIFPIPAGKLTVDVKPNTTMPMLTSLDMVTSIPALGRLAFWLANKYVDTDKSPYDIVIAVMPKGTIRTSGSMTQLVLSSPPAAGVNYSQGKYFWNSSERVLLVDSSTPIAFVHELGHAAGLYRSTEQYDMPEYKKTEGMPLSTFSAAALSHPTIMGFNNSTGIINFPPPKVNWYKGSYRWLDVMGLSEWQTWPSPYTHWAIMNFMNKCCASATTSASTAAPAGQPSNADDNQTAEPLSGEGNAPSELTPGTYFVAGGPSRRIDETVGQYPVPGAWLLDGAGMADPPEIPDESGVNWFQHGIMRFMNNSTVITNVIFDLPSTQLSSAWWSYRWPKPAGCNHVRLLWEKNGETLVGEWEAAGTLSVDIDESSLAVPLARKTELAWSVSASAPAANSHIYSQLAYSLDNGTTWIDWDAPTTETNRLFDNEFLPISSTIALRVTASDGFSMAQDTVTGLQVVDRTPTITVLSPRTNDVALTDTEWTLTAHAADVEDGLLTVSWSSSRDGAITTNTTLSTGNHILTASATDSHGNTATATFPVKVVDRASDVDLTIDDFHRAGRQLDIQSNPLLREKGMALNTTNVLECVIYNSGICTTGRLNVAISYPSGATLNWSTNNVEFAAFSRSRFFIPLIPDEYGIYHATATVIPAILPDRNPGDNRASCVADTLMPALLPEKYQGRRQGLFSIAEAYYDIIFGSINESFYFHNGGTAPLTITNMTLVNSYTGNNPSVKLGTAAPMTIEPGEHQEILIQYYDTTQGVRRDSVLHVYSDDPVHPHLEIPVYCWVIPTNSTPDTPWRDGDDDLLPDYVENIIGTATNNADTDGDGIPDGYEDFNGNGIVDARETSPLLSDTDGDGISDGDEDSNHNGGMDFGETSPRLADTDGDTLSDYAELITKTSPVDKDSRLACGRIFSDKFAGETVIRWQAKKGVHYRIEQCTHLIGVPDWSTAPSGSGDDYQADRTATADGTLTFRSAHPGTTKIYYRVVVIP